MAGKKRFGVLLFLSLCVALSCFAPAQAAQEPAFRLNIDSLNLRLGASYDLVISVINAQGAQIDAVEGLEHFNLLSQSQSTSTSTVNGATTHQVDLHLTILPVAAGTFTLKGIITYNDQVYETNALEVTVTDGPAEDGSLPDLFVETALSHEEAYLGEKIILTYTLYTRKDIESISFGENLSVDGAILKDVSDTQPSPQSAYVDGNHYTLYEIRRIIMDPMKTGVCVIPSITVQANVITEDTMGGWGGFWQTSTPQYVQTEAKELTIKPLPAEGRPDDFSGIVGDLRLDAAYSRSEISYGDSLVLQVDVSGQCNLDTLKKITPGGIPGFTVYENQKNTEETISDGQYHIQSTYELIMIPEQTGEQVIAPLRLSYFNPVSAQYETAEIPGATIAVLGDMPQAVASGTGGATPLEPITINQVSYGSDDAGEDYVLRLPKRTLHIILIGAGALLLLAIAIPLVIVIRRRRRSPDRLLSRRVMKAADKNELLDLFNEIIKQRYGVSVKALSRERIKSALPDQAIAERVLAILDEIEGDAGSGKSDLAGLKGRIRQFISS